MFIKRDITSSIFFRKLYLFQPDPKDPLAAKKTNEQRVKLFFIIMIL